MKIGLIDVDGHRFPNLPLMKISAYHKQRGDEVEMCFMDTKYDTVYMSKVFDFTPDYPYVIHADEIIRGGTGYKNLPEKNELPDIIEYIYPDYSLYGITDTAYGFLTRGCPRRCPFCIVSKKEGHWSRTVTSLHNFWRGQKNIRLLDPNILACKTVCKCLLQNLADTGATVDFTQGLDARLLNVGIIKILNKIRMKTIHFAWDSEKDSMAILCGLEMYAKTSPIKPHCRVVYVLTNFDTSFDFDLERVYTLRMMGFAPYIMVYNRQTADDRYRRLQRWVNNRFIFWKCETFVSIPPTASSEISPGIR